MEKKQGDRGRFLHRPPSGFCIWNRLLLPAGPEASPFFRPSSLFLRKITKFSSHSWESDLLVVSKTYTYLFSNIMQNSTCLSYQNHTHPVPCCSLTSLFSWESLSQSTIFWAPFYRQSRIVNAKNTGINRICPIYNEFGRRPPRHWTPTKCQVLGEAFPPFNCTLYCSLQANPHRPY